MEIVEKEREEAEKARERRGGELRGERGGVVGPEPLLDGSKREDGDKGALRMDADLKRGGVRVFVRM